ncbi:sam-dependent methyltransferase [Nannochloropsis oceanica]
MLLSILRGIAARRNPVSRAAFVFLHPSPSQSITITSTVSAASYTRPSLPMRRTNGGRIKSTVVPLTQRDEEDADNAAPAQPKQKKQQARKQKPWQGPFLYHEELELTVDSLTNLGLGICRTSLPLQSSPTFTSDSNSSSSPIPPPPPVERERSAAPVAPESWVIMVPGVIPGERIRLRIYRNHKNYSEADLVEVIEASPARVEPVCSLFGRCGGCQYQHMSITAQRDWKQQHVVDVLARTGNITNVAVQKVIGTDDVLGYRSKITPHHEKPRGGEIKDIGFLKLGSRALVDVEQCAIATPAINARLMGLREEVRARARAAAAEETPKKPKGATLFLRETQEGVVTDPRVEVSDKIRGLTFKYTAGSFFQNNPFMLPEMVGYVTGKAREGGMRFLVDAYCGGGLFCLSASKDFEACYGVEISELAILSARRNADLNEITNCHFRAGDASDIFAGIKHIRGQETVMIIDPPRKGCDEDFLTQLCAFRPARIVYVSCDPATQARDAQVLVRSGYEIEELQPFDLFPQTRHIENVIVFADARLSGPGHGPAAPAAAE